MHENTAVMDLIASYDTYADVDELNVSAAADAPATTLPCAAAAASSWKCIAFSISVSASTIDQSC